MCSASLGKRIFGKLIPTDHLSKNKVIIFEIPKLSFENATKVLTQ